MTDYMNAVICAVAVSGIIMLIVFHRLEVLNFRTVASITLASLITALIMPAIYSALIGGEADKAGLTDIIMITIAAFIAYVVIVLIMSILISVIVPQIKPRSNNRKTSETEAGESKSDEGTSGKTLLEQVGALYFSGSADETRKAQSEAAAGQAEIMTGTSIAETDTEIREQTASGPDVSYAPEGQPDAGMTDQSAASASDEGPLPVPETVQEPEVREIREGGSQKPAYAGDNYLEQIYLNYVAHDDENTGMQEEAVEITGAAAWNAEKSVDSAENIDKMGIENRVYDSEAMTIEECIDEAFRLKQTGDFEGAILYFMYALDKKPQRELTFWIILDICVMYKSLGQQDLALEILNGYYEAYGDTMDVRLRDDIIRDLTDAGV